MFYQNSNRSDLSTEWDSEDKRLYINFNKEEIEDITIKFTYNQLCDLKEMIDEIFMYEGMDWCE